MDKWLSEELRFGFFFFLAKWIEISNEASHRWQTKWQSSHFCLLFGLFFKEGTEGNNAAAVTNVLSLLMELRISRCSYCNHSYLLLIVGVTLCHYVLYVLHQWAGAFSVTAQPYITTIKMYLIWKGQLFILISSFLKRCFNVIYISHWLFKLLNVCIII